MVGPYIPVTESEILNLWPIRGFQLVDRPTASGGTKSGAERKAPPKAPETPKEVRGLERMMIPSQEKNQAMTTPT